MRDVSNQQVTDHLKRLNLWWQPSRMDANTLSMHPRAYLTPIRQLLLEPSLRRAIALLGPRRVATLLPIRLLMADPLHRGTAPRRRGLRRMHDPLWHGRPLGALTLAVGRATRAGEGTRYLFFDDIQSHQDWEEHRK